MQKRITFIFAIVLLSNLSFAQGNNIKYTAAVAADTSGVNAAAAKVNDGGIISVQSSVAAGVWLNGLAVGITPFLMELYPGWVVYSVRSPGYWTEVSLANIELGGKTSIEIELKKYGLPLGEMFDVQHINDLKVLENLYDSLHKHKQNFAANSDSICIAAFVANYPMPISPPGQLSESSGQYRYYYEIYSHEKQLSFNEWYANCHGTEQNLSEISKRINELGETKLNGYTPVVDGKFEPADSSGLKGNLELHLVSPGGRADVIWKGVWENDFLTGTALIAALTASTPSALAFLTAQNQTVWIPIEGGYSRHFYKYHDLTISWKGWVIPMEGKFILPEWLAAFAPLPVEEVKPKPVVAAKPAADTVAGMPKAFLAKIPGGYLKYRGTDTEIMSFYINTNVISQDLYKDKCGKKDFGKYKGDSLPAHSVNWKEANACCVALGGELPTEAQWEYAARAGSPLKNIWGNNRNLKDYAEFDGKRPISIASKKPNGWGLYDMLGNVAEWVKDDGFWYGKYKYLKGGSWKSDEKDLNVESREEEDARYWGTHTGFRCVFK